MRRLVVLPEDWRVTGRVGRVWGREVEGSTKVGDLATLYL